MAQNLLITLLGAIALGGCAAAAPPLRVFLIPHSHEDPGWMQTIEEYYHGWNHNHYGVKVILDGITAELTNDPRRRYIQVEVAFFSIWWEDPNTTDATREKWKRLVANGQIEMVLGGWVMQDEIASSFDADINQLTLGHKWLTDHGFAAPTKGWQIDSQGNIGATAAMYAGAGFDGAVGNRIRDRVRNEMQATQTLEFNWQGIDSALIMPEDRAGATIAHHAMDTYGYCPPNVPRNMYYWDDYEHVLPFLPIPFLCDR